MMSNDGEGQKNAAGNEHRLSLANKFFPVGGETYMLLARYSFYEAGERTANRDRASIHLVRTPREEKQVENRFLDAKYLIQQTRKGKHLTYTLNHVFRQTEIGPNSFLCFSYSTPPRQLRFLFRS